MVFVGSDGSMISILVSSSLGLEASAAETRSKTTVTIVNFATWRTKYFLVQSYARGQLSVQLTTSQLVSPEIIPCTYSC